MKVREKESRERKNHGRPPLQKNVVIFQVKRGKKKLATVSMTNNKAPKWVVVSQIKNKYLTNNRSYLEKPEKYDTLYFQKYGVCGLYTPTFLLTMVVRDPFTAFF